MVVFPTGPERGGFLNIPLLIVKCFSLCLSNPYFSFTFFSFYKSNLNVRYFYFRHHPLTLKCSESVTYIQSTCDPHLNLPWPFYTHRVFDCDWPHGGAQLHFPPPPPLEPIISSLVEKCLYHIVVHVCACVIWLVWFLCVKPSGVHVFCVGPWGALWTADPCHDTVLLTTKLSDSLCQLLFPWLPFIVTFSASWFGIYIQASSKTPQWHFKQSQTFNQT